MPRAKTVLIEKTCIDWLEIRDGVQPVQLRISTQSVEAL